MSSLFSALKLRELTIPNRIFLSPMCQYSSPNGQPNNWHFAHLGARAAGGVGLTFTEACAVNPQGRISPDDLGIWNDEQMNAFRGIVSFIKSQGSIAGIQLAHAGRKASVEAPWLGGKALSHEHRGWQPCAPSPIPFNEKFQTPDELTETDLKAIEGDFIAAAQRAIQAGFQVAEVHAAHGYLLHQFLSPLSNKRSDQYGGPLENRMKFPLQIAQAVRNVWPDEYPVFVRVSATDWIDGGWDLDQTAVFCQNLKEIGIDFIDCSSGGLVPDAVIPAGPGFQVPFATQIKKSTGILTGTVGLITKAAQAEQIVATGLADAVLLGRELLRTPCWPLLAAQELGTELPWPVQYERAKP
jgi:2,4-dienoyl-CoA reductase-like NADH-dependent reductase (Old Yellow Enzyme family)